MKKRSKLKNDGIVFDIVNTVVMILFAVVMVYPLWYVLVASFTDYKELMSNSGMLIWPINPTVAAYDMAF